MSKNNLKQLVDDFEDDYSEVYIIVDSNTTPTVEQQEAADYTSTEYNALLSYLRSPETATADSTAKTLLDPSTALPGMRDKTRRISELLSRVIEQSVELHPTMYALYKAIDKLEQNLPQGATATVLGTLDFEHIGERWSTAERHHRVEDDSGALFSDEYITFGAWQALKCQDQNNMTLLSSGLEAITYGLENDLGFPGVEQKYWLGTNRGVAASCWWLIRGAPFIWETIKGGEADVLRRWEPTKLWPIEKGDVVTTERWKLWAKRLSEFSMLDAPDFHEDWKRLVPRALKHMNDVDADLDS